jgi:hypothetical protein
MNFNKTRFKFNHRHFGRIGVSFLIIAFSSYIFFRIAPYDPDPHHDGIQLAPVIGILEGKHIHGELFEQYGPVWDWIKTLFLAFLGPELIKLRYMASIMAVATCFMIFKISLRIIGSYTVSLLLTGIWVFTSPALNTINNLNFPLWPWPSLLLNLAILMLFNKFLSDFNVKDLNYQKISAVLTSFLITVCLFTRLQIGLILIFGISFIIYKYQAKSKIVIAYYLVSLILFVSLVFIYLISTNSLSYFFLQTVIGPLNTYVSPISASYIFVNFCLGVMPLIFYLFIIKKFSSGSWHLKFSSIFLTIFLGLFLIYVGKIYDKFYLNNFSLTRAILDIQSHSIIYFAFTFCGFFAIFFFLGHLNHRAFNSHTGSLKIFSKSDRLLNVVAIFSSFCLIQAYPIQDIYHLWWASPVLLISLMYLLKLLGINKKTLTSMSIACFLPIIVFGVNSFAIQVQIPRITSDFGSLRGMQIQESKFSDFETANSFFADLGDLNGIYNCPDALFSVWSGKYRVTDGNYVGWAWNTVRAGGITKGSPWVLCSNDLSYALSWAQSNNLSTPIKVVGPLNLSPWSTTSLYYFLRN